MAANLCITGINGNLRYIKAYKTAILNCSNVLEFDSFYYVL